MTIYYDATFKVIDKSANILDLAAKQAGIENWLFNISQRIVVMFGLKSQLELFRKILKKKKAYFDHYYGISYSVPGKNASKMELKRYLHEIMFRNDIRESKKSQKFEEEFWLTKVKIATKNGGGYIFGNEKDREELDRLFRNAK